MKYQPVKSLVSRHLLMNIHAIVTKSLTIVTVRKRICDVNEISQTLVTQNIFGIYLYTDICTHIYIWLSTF